MSQIIAIGTALPPYRHRQQEVCGFMKDFYGLGAADSRKLDFLYGHSGIEFRYSVLPDFSSRFGKRDFYPEKGSPEPFPGLDERMECFRRLALPLSLKACERCLKNFTGVTHLITVTCTGLSAPGLDIQILQAMKWPGSVARTSLNFMGCYGGLHALRMADAICGSNPEARVLVVCTELCTLHFQDDYAPDQVTSSLIFGDGSAAVLVAGKSYRGPGLTLEQFCSALHPEGKKDMSWAVTSKGFRMALSRNVPRLIREGIEPLVNDALSALGLSRDQMAAWAIHPGGKKILEGVVSQLHLEGNALAPSFDILRQYGNMSSPTILFVLEAIWKAGSLESGERLFAAAFGPGLTMEGVILRIKSR